MDKNTIIGFLLMGAVIFAFSYLNRPDQAQIEAARLRNDSIARVMEEQAARDLAAARAEAAAQAIVADTADTDSARYTRLQDEFGAFAPCAEGDERIFTLENDRIRLTFNSKGGRIAEAELKDYKNYDSLPVILFGASDNDYGFTFKTGSRIINTSDLYFETIPTADGKGVTMRLNLGDTRFFDLVYSLRPDSYIVDLAVRQNGMEEILPASTSDLDLYWTQALRRQEKGKTFEERNSGLYYKFKVDDVEYLSESKNEKKEIVNELKWIGYKNQFFSTALIAGNAFNWASLESQLVENSETYLKQFRTFATTAYDPASPEPLSFRLFLGPNSYPLLKQLSKADNGADLELDKLVPLGPSIFRFVNTWLVIPLFTFFGKFIGNYGIIILLLTLVIKLILMPLTYKSYMSTAKMRVLKPQIEEINARYPGQEKAMDRQKATMELYGRVGINPMSGCLPMLLQLPILIAMFSFFPSSIELRGESFLWAKDLSSYDAIVSWNTYIPLITPYFGNHISLFCLLMTITNIVYTKINMDSTGSATQMPGMKFMMYIMPLMFLFIFNNYASGLSYYYFISTLITIIQTYIFRKSINEEKVLAKLEENKKKPRKKTGFMARLENAQREAQRQQAEAAKQRAKKRR